MTEAWADRLQDADGGGDFDAKLEYTGLSKSVVAGVKGGATAAANRTDATWTFSDVTGSADAATLVLDGAKIHDAIIGGVETLNVKTQNADSTLNKLDAQAATKIVITGDKALTVAATDFDATTAYEVDASALTGNLTITLGEAAKQTFKGGSGNDTVFLANRLSATDSIDGGTGSNTIGLTDASTLSAATGALLKNFQSIDVAGAATGTFDMDFITGGATATTITGGVKVSGALTANNNVQIDNLAVGGTVTFTAGSNNGGTTETLTVNQKGASGAGRTTDVLNVSISPSGTQGDINVDTLVVANVETIKVSSGENAGYTAGHTIQALTTTSATTLELTGNEQLTISAATLAGGNVNIDASAMTDKFIMGAAFGGGAVQAIKGGSAADTLISNGVSGTTLQGNGGADLYTLSAVGAGGVSETIKFAAATDSTAAAMDAVVSTNGGFNVGAVTGSAATVASYTITAAQIAALFPGQVLNIVTDNAGAGAVTTAITLKSAIAGSTGTDVTVDTLYAQLDDNANQQAGGVDKYLVTKNLDGTITITTNATGTSSTIDVETALFAGKAAVDGSAVTAASDAADAAFTLAAADIANLVAGQKITVTLTQQTLTGSTIPVDVTLTGDATSGVPTATTVAANITAALVARDAAAVTGSKITVANVAGDVVLTAKGDAGAGGVTASADIDVKLMDSVLATDLAGTAKAGSAAVIADAADKINVAFVGFADAYKSVAATTKATITDSGADAAGATLFTISDANKAAFFTNGGVQTGVVYQTGANNNDTLVFVDANKNGAWDSTDMVIELTGVNTTEAAGFTAANFVWA